MQINNKCWQQCGDPGKLMHWWWERKRLQPLWHGLAIPKNARKSYHMTQQYYFYIHVCVYIHIYTYVYTYTHTPSWLSGSWRSFFYSFSVYSCHLFLISSASLRSITILSFIVSIFAWNIPLISLIFLRRSLVFPLLLFSSISLHWSLWIAFLFFLLFFGTLHSDGYRFPFLLCL